MGTNSFRQTLRGIRQDFGGPLFVGVVVAMIGVWVAAFFALHRARTFYVSVATFHGYLELAMAAYFWVRGGRGALAPARCDRARAVEGSG